MRVLVTGANGMLGKDVCSALRREGHEPLPTDVVGEVTSMDITNVASVEKVFGELCPDVVIHCAAYTNVDQSERDPDAAYRVNALGSWTLGAACASRDIPVLAISTDFVFDGFKTEPYTEFDAPNPLSHYGASKLAGESCIRQACRKYWIVRTAWLFGVHGKSFPDSILNAAETRPVLRVVADQHGTPTYTVDLADCLVRIMQSPLYGVYHVANKGVTTWYEFARKALELAGMSHVSVIPITASDWPSPTRRPAYSALRPFALELQNAPTPRPWEEALAAFIQERNARRSATR